YLSASSGFFNPFGGKITPGSRRGEVTLEMKPLKNSTLRFGATSERNRTANVDNGRLTFSAAWDQVLSDRIRFHLGFDHRAFTDNGFASSSARRETAFGVETRFGKHTSMTGRYQLENGINGTDSFAVIGLQDRLPLTKKLSLDLGFERGFHLLGPNQSFNSATFGFGWQPNSDLRATARYEYRDRGGIGQLFAAGVAGKLSEGNTALPRFSFSRR